MPVAAGPGTAGWYGRPTVKDGAGFGRGLAVGALAALLYLGVGVFDHEIWSPAEPAVAGVVWEMWAHGDLAVPRIDGVPYLEKPPLSYWMSWLSCGLGGLEPGWLRLPSALCALGCVALLFASVRSRHGAAVASVTALLAATTYTLIALGHRAGNDALAMLCAFAGYALYTRSLAEPDPRRRRRLDLALAAILALSFYAKNLFVPLIVAAPVALHLLLGRELRRLLVLGALSVALTALVVLPWALALRAEGGLEFLRVVFLDNTLGRFLHVPLAWRPEVGPLNDAFFVERETSRWVYLVQLPAVPAPWSLAFLAALPALFRECRGDRHRGFLALAVVSVPAILSLSDSRNDGYLRPLLFVQMAIVAELLSALFAGRAGRLARRLWQLNLAVAGLALLALPVVLAIAFDRAAWALGTLPVAGALAWHARRSRPFLDGPDAAIGWLGIAVLVLFAALRVAVPQMDARRSNAPFFRAVEPDLAGRAVYTTLLDDRTLPLVNWYLRRRVPVVGRTREVEALLRGEEPAAILMGRGDWLRLAPRFVAALPRVLTDPGDGFVLVTNPVAERTSTRIPKGSRGSSGPRD
jgi:4-amino-4-deoxy-L-arabinose transferase-like glycosyltransferase